MEPRIEFITGSAGTGKTTELKKRITKSKKTPGERNYGTLCATTGIAAVNLNGGSDDNVCTINSELRFFDTEDMLDKGANGKIFNALKSVAVKGLNLVIDEISMMEDKQLDCLYDNLVAVNKLDWVQGKGGLGLVISGDFCQLPPVSGNPVFNARHWDKFAEHTTRLTKIWRQDNLRFLEGINAARCGDGDKAAEILASLKEVSWREQLNSKFEGTTIVATNREVDRINQSRLTRLVSEGNKEVRIKNFRWGNQRPEWKLIPSELEIAENAYVMVLSNDTPEFSFANGDCGYFRGEGGAKRVVFVELCRNNTEVQIAPVIRRIWSKFTPDGMQDAPKYLTKKEWKDEKFDVDSDDSVSLQYKRYLTNLTIENKGEWGKPWFDFVEGKWVIGEIDYVPIRLAYASTVHKTQGLSLDRIQIDYHHEFFGSPSMSYVALSRCKTPGGLVVVGSPKLLAKRTNVTSDVVPWF